MNARRLILYLLLTSLVGALPAVAQTDTVVYATAQRYENGLMIWRADTSHIWALADSGQAFSFPATTYAHLPDNPIFGSPPSRLRPILGMGKVWGHYPEVRMALGWPVLAEIGFDMPVRWEGRTLYLTQLDGSVIRINADGTWQRQSATLAPPDVSVFDVSPASSIPGGTIMLTWQVQGTDAVLLELYNGSNSAPVRLIEDLPLASSTTLTLPPEITTFAHVILWGVNRGQTYPVPMWARMARSELDVQIAPPDASFETYAAYQRYEHGFLIWRADTGSVLVFADNGQFLWYPKSTYAPWPDAEDFDIPPNRVRPVNAFAKVWAGQPYVRDLLGYAGGSEQGYSLHVEGRYPDGLFNNYTVPDGRVAQVVGDRWQF